MRVLVAMSGGVDSSVAAARMVDAGHDVVGVHLALSSAPGTLRTGSRGCCSKEDAGDARRVADVLGIPFYVWDFADRFAEDVIDDFVDSYARGETPNPCVRCNERIKFSALASRALALGFDALATGHYAQLSEGRLRRAVDTDKDQSYVLAVLTADQLAHAMFPIGDTPKARIRQEAAQRGLAVAQKADSHDICFIPSGDTQAFLGARIGVRRGSVVDLHFTRSTSTADPGGRTSWENSRFSDETLYPAGRGKDRTQTDKRDEGPAQIKLDPFCCDGLGRSVQRLQTQIELVKVS